jgi:tRNA (cmo5U34)-methyltransferase
LVNRELWNPATYDGLRRQLIPSLDLLYDSAASVVALSLQENESPAILDLVAGTGLLSAAIMQWLPHARLFLTDRSEPMLARASSRFARAERVTCVVADLTEPLPNGRFEAVVSALAIHHLAHEEKKKLFGRILDALAPAGIFVNVEQVLAPSGALEQMYDAQHERHVLEWQTPTAEWAAGRERMKHDICADLDSQLRWLREAGFAQVDCLAKDWRFATYAAWVSG